MLAFAHAVGSPGGLLQAACSQLQDLACSVQVGQKNLRLPLRKVVYSFDDTTAKLKYESLAVKAEWTSRFVSQEQRQELRTQLASQLGALLHMAHVLQLQVLIDKLHAFIFFNTAVSKAPFLKGVLELVFIDLVLEAAMGSSTISKEAWISSMLSQPCSFSAQAFCHNRLLKPLGAFTCDPTTGVQRFKAKLLQDFAGLHKGAEVDVELDLFRRSCPDLRLSAGSKELCMSTQLLLGHMVTDAADYKLLMYADLQG